MLDNIKFGLIKTSLNDYPGHIASTIFLSGCNMRCPFCQNIQLIDGNFSEGFLRYNEIINFLEKRKKTLQGVCITGGEPTLLKQLKTLIENIKNLGFKVKLDTNGTAPELLNSLPVDYIAMDIKTSLKKYNLCGYKNRDNILKSINIIKNLNIDYEFRTTAVRGLIDYEDFENIADMIKGAKKYKINNFNNKKVLDPLYQNILPYSKDELDSFKAIFVKQKIDCSHSLE